MEKEGVKRVSLTIYQKELDFINNFEGANFSDKLREIIRSYEFITSILTKIGSQLQEKQISLNDEDIEFWEEGQEKYKLNITHIKAFIRFKLGMEKAMGKEFSEMFINKILLSEEYLDL